MLQPYCNRIKQKRASVVLTLSFSLARRLAEGPTLSFARTKRLFLDAMGTSFAEHLEHERDVQVQSTLTGDYETGVRAMIDRSAPKFSGK